METKYIKDEDFVEFVRGIKKTLKVEMVNLEGSARWVVTNDDGSKFYIRPLSAKPNES